MKKSTIRNVIIIGISLVIVGIAILLVASSNRHQHSWKEVIINATCEVDGEQYEECECGNKQKHQTIKARGHIYVEGLCSICGSEEGHIHNIVVDASILATCTTVGLTEGSHCSDCGKVIVEQLKLAKLGHDLQEWRVHSESTTDINGEKRRTCSRCDYYESTSLPLIDHEYEILEIVEPTCAEYGYTIYKCTDCENYYQDDFIQKINHQDKITEVETTCTEDGYLKHECENCGRIYLSDYEMAIGHIYGEWETIIEATCTTLGLDKKSCIHCYDEQTRNVEMIEHDYHLMEETSLSTIKVTYECSECQGQITIDSNSDLQDYTNTELLNQEEDFSFTIIYNGDDVDYIKNNLIIIDDYFEDSEYENAEEIRIEYVIEKASSEHNTWVISPKTTYEQGITYMAKLSGNLGFEDFYGDKLTFTIKSEEKNIVEYNSGILFLQKLENTDPGYYPYFLSSSESSEYIYLTIQKADNINIGDVIFVGEAVTFEEIYECEDGVFGKVEDIYLNSNDEYLLKLSCPELTEIFEKLDISQDTTINFDDYPEIQENIGEEVLASLYQSEDFLTFLAAADATTTEYLGNRKLLSAPLTNYSFRDKVKIEMPKIKYSGSTMYLTLRGSYNSTVKTSTGVEVGTFSISFSIETKVSFSVATDYKIKYWLIFPTGIEYFNLGLTQTDEFIFDFEISFDIDYGLAESEQPKYVYQTDNYKIHTADCLYLTKNTSKIVSIKTEEVNEYATKTNFTTCDKCKPIEMIEETSFIINNSSKTIHTHDCEKVKEIVPEYKKYYYGNINEVVDYNKCSICKPETKEQKEFEDMLLNALEYRNWQDSVNQIKDWVNDAGIEEYQQSGIKLCTLKWKIGSVLTVNLDLNLVLNFDFKASLNYHYEQSHINIYGIRLKNKKVTPYATHQEKEKLSDLSVVGEMNFAAGINAEAYFSFIGLSKWVQAGFTAEAGVQLHMNGIADISNSNGNSYFGIYMEAGPYINIEAYYKLFKKEDSLNIYSLNYPIFKYGYDKSYYGYVTDLEEITFSEDEYILDIDKLLEVYYFDVKDQTTKTEVLDVNSKLYKVVIELETGKYCEIKDGKLLLKDDAPNNFTDTLLINVSGNSDWKKYTKGSCVIFLDTLRIAISYTNSTIHEHLVSDWIIDEEATCIREGKKHIECTLCKEILSEETIAIADHTIVIDQEVTATCEKSGLTEGSHCSLCKEVIKKQALVDALGHNYVDGKCTRCNIEDNHIHTETSWIIDENATCSKEGKKHTECTICQAIIKSEALEKIPHTLEDDIKVEATCESSGLKEGYHCTVCEFVFKEEVTIEALGHDFVDGICIRCETLENVESLEYQISDDGQYYIVIGLGTYEAYYNSLEIVIPNSYNNLPVKEIGEYVFANTMITKIELPNALESIGAHAFENCSTLTDINLPDSVKYIGEGAFYSCGVSNINIPKSMTSIGSGAFSGTWLTSIIIPSHVKNIEQGAFSSNPQLTTIIMEEGIESIGENAFGGNRKITEVNIPSTVSSIETMAFLDCGSLTTINVSLNNPYYQSIDGVLYTKDGTRLVQYPAGKVDETFTVPNGVQYINSRAVYACNNLVNVVMPSSIKNIGLEAFRSCYKLQTVTFNPTSSLEQIEYAAFELCSQLTSIIIPSSVQKMGGYIFYGCRNLTIYCEVTAKPDGWNSTWNGNRPVEWGYIG